jgi:hypothetical protein
MGVSEVAAALRVTEKTIKNRMAAGLPMPPSFVVGRKRLFLPDQFAAWLRSQPGAVLEGHSGAPAAPTPLPNRRPRRPGRPRQDP